MQHLGGSKDDLTPPTYLLGSSEPNTRHDLRPWLLCFAAKLFITYKYG